VSSSRRPKAAARWDDWHSEVPGRNDAYTVLVPIHRLTGVGQGWGSGALIHALVADADPLETWP
jgi:hypothetical protein